MNPTVRNTTIIVVLAVLVIGVFALTMIGEETRRKPTATTTEPTEKRQVQKPTQITIGQSIQGRPITATTYGSGDTHLVFVGAIHGGYEWNTVLLAQKLMQYLEGTPSPVPDGMQVTVIPMLNPDGVVDVMGTTTFARADAPPTSQTTKGRFNANDVDLNRNFGCQWEPEGVWRGQRVNAGSSAFSEPEARAMRDFTRSHDPDAVVFFHSAAGGVYGAACDEPIATSTKQLMTTYADAAGYDAIEKFDHYEVTGDAESWHTKLGIPSVSVELTTHSDVEWHRNKRAIKALFRHYSTQ